MVKTQRAILLLIVSLMVLGLRPATTDAASLNINTATETELTSLPYIGPIRASKIMACRKERGPFKEFKELLACDGIGPETLKIMQADLTLITNSLPSPASPPQDQESDEPAKIKTSQGDIIILANADYFPALVSKIQGAKTDIRLTMFVFKTTASARNKANILVDELAAAAKRGIKVQVFLEKSGYDDRLNETNQQTTRKLRRHGVKVSFDSPKITTHTKLVVIDQRFSFVGSHNFTHSALRSNNELSLLVDDQVLASKLIDYIEGISQ